MTSPSLRQQVLSQRRQLNAAARAQAAQQVLQQIAHTLLFQRSQHLAFYLPHRGELDPTPLLQLAWQQRKHCYLPVLHPLALNRLWFMPYAPDDPLRPNRYGILEPVLNTKHLMPAWALQLVFTPLVAFDEHGHRLGMGGGFYDRTFAFLQTTRRTRPYLIGLAYEFQKAPYLTPKPWDITLYGVVTEKQIYFC